jgi:hypothetical protein
MITVINRAALAAYCQSYGRWAQAGRTLAAGELVIKTVRGNLVYNPLVRIGQGDGRHGAICSPLKESALLRCGS